MPKTKPQGLMAKLAAKLNVDLLDLQRSGRISPGAVSRMQGRCSLCGEPGECEAMMDNAGYVMDEAPDFCPNRRLFAELKQTARDIRREEAVASSTRRGARRLVSK